MWSGRCHVTRSLPLRETTCLMRDRADNEVNDYNEQFARQHHAFRNCGTVGASKCVYIYLSIRGSGVVLKRVTPPTTTPTSKNKIDFLHMLCFMLNMWNKIFKNSTNSDLFRVWIVFICLLNNVYECWRSNWEWLDNYTCMHIFSRVWVKLSGSIFDKSLKWNAYILLRTN